MVVVYGLLSVDLHWAADAEQVILVHNDERLIDVGLPDGPAICDVRPGSNVGFGAAVNLAVQHVRARRVAICNPDVSMTREQFVAVASGGDDDIVTLPLRGPDGSATPVVLPYPTALSHLLTGIRAGRWLGTASRLRRMLSPLLGKWGREYVSALTASGTWKPLATHWVSGAAFSLDVQRFCEVGGFDESYFLYFEDIDLCRRLAQRYPDMRVVTAASDPAQHVVGASANDPVDAAMVRQVRLDGAIRYAAAQAGFRWSVVGRVLRTWKRVVL